MYIIHTVAISLTVRRWGGCCIIYETHSQFKQNFTRVRFSLDRIQPWTQIPPLSMPTKIFIILCMVDFGCCMRVTVMCVLSLFVKNFGFIKVGAYAFIVKSSWKFDYWKSFRDELNLLCHKLLNGKFTDELTENLDLIWNSTYRRRYNYCKCKSNHGPCWSFRSWDNRNTQYIVPLYTETFFYVLS